jgi:Na+/proline symporter
LVLPALYWKGATKHGAYACVITVALTWLYFFWKSGFGGEYTVAHIMPVAICFASGLVAMIVVSLFTQKPSEETIRKFFV